MLRAYRPIVTVVSHFFWNWYLFRRRPWVWKFACAGIAPDLPYVLLLGYYSLRFRANGFADLMAWELVWRSPIASGLHSFVPWSIAVAAVLCFAPAQRRRALAPLLAGWLSHIVADMLTHRSDGYPIFYPLSTYRFATPISYWEPAYHGRAFMLIDTTCIIVLLAHHLAVRRTRAARLATQLRVAPSR